MQERVQGERMTPEYTAGRSLEEPNRIVGLLPLAGVVTFIIAEIVRLVAVETHDSPIPQPDRSFDTAATSPRGR
ncbi:hypothetical protein SAMN05216554_2207 [Herbiconiux ginsengi]|uniref:Uncharacterized protein n=1 Tax=Herbiconiux ginsengi TaxID=381665 RepID=A0A1H3Q0C0_9MICO|nr:hypothetical protein SAMN05216554_2207 [Herbiconiux ginsengi]